MGYRDYSRCNGTKLVPEFVGPGNTPSHEMIDCKGCDDCRMRHPPIVAGSRVGKSLPMLEPTREEMEDALVNLLGGPEPWVCPDSNGISEAIRKAEERVIFAAAMLTDKYQEDSKEENKDNSCGCCNGWTLIEEEKELMARVEEYRKTVRGT